jgi:hypothetical protein
MNAESGVASSAGIKQHRHLADSIGAQLEDSKFIELQQPFCA